MYFTAWRTHRFILRNAGWQRSKPWLWKWRTCRPALPVCLPHLFYSLECQEQDLKRCYYLFCSDPHVAALKPALYHLKTIVRISIAGHGKDPEMVLWAPSPGVAWFARAASYCSTSPVQSPTRLSTPPVPRLLEDGRG